MNKFIKIIFFVIINLSFLFLSTAKAIEKIKIGLLVPMTGSNRDLGQSIIKAVRLAVKDIDSDLIEIIPKDTATRPNQTLKSAFELKQMGVKVVIGPLGEFVFAEALRGPVVVKRKLRVRLQELRLLHSSPTALICN